MIGKILYRTNFTLADMLTVGMITGLIVETGSWWWLLAVLPAGIFNSSMEGYFK